MRIQHNIMAMNAYRNYNNNTSALAKNLEKLSSGYRINRAGDDAAGLAISEKMRAQITALGTAQKNVKDGISLVKTAEGATQEIHDMLNRMVDLATQSANGTYQDKVDREAIESEFNALKTEIDRIADASNFNGIKLLDGSMNGVGKVAYSNINLDPVADGVAKGGEAEKGLYKVDLKGLSIDVSGALLSSSVAFAISVGGVTIGNFALNADYTGTDAATFTMGDFTFTPASSSVTLGNLDFDVSFTDGQIVLTGTGKGGADPTDADVTAMPSMKVNIVDAHTKVDGNGQDRDYQVHAEKPVAAAGARKYAHAEHTFADADIKDGLTLKIGDDVYSFKVGKDGKGGEGTVIDLSNMEEGATGIASKAIDLLSQQANSKFHLTSNGKGVLGIEEVKGSFKDYSEWDLNGDDATAQDATWLNTKGESVLQIGEKGAATGTALTLQIGEDSEKYNKLELNIKDMHVDALGLDKHTLSTQKGAQDAVAAIKDAINYVSTVRSDLGATQNRLEHTSNNLSVMKENIQDAEATIRDTDVAEEMMAYTKNNILVQSAQAMLAQANQIPQGVLQLLG